MKERMTTTMRKTMSRWDDLQLNERETCVCVKCVCACVCSRGQEADWSGGGALCQTPVQGGVMVNWSTCEVRV